MHLTFERATKFYGSVIAVNGIDCKLGPGIIGLVGANGAGKSTFLKLASGQIRPSQGRVMIGGEPATSVAARRRMGFSPDVDRFFSDLTGRAFVEAMARLHGMTRRDAREQADQALARFGMGDRADRRLGSYSHGMRQRVKLAQALVHDPDVLLLDEPLNGIDPVGRREIRELLAELAESKKTIVVSSHVLHEIEQLASVFIVLSRGRLAAAGPLAEIRQRISDSPRSVRIDSSEPARLASLAAFAPGVECIEFAEQGAIVRTRRIEEFLAWLGETVVVERLNVVRLETLDVGAEALFGFVEGGA